MGDLRVLNREYLFNEITPPKTYKEYFRTIVSDKEVYVTIILDDDQRPSIYLEKNDNFGLCRMFFRKEEAREYVNSISQAKKIPIGIIRSWETSFSEFSRFLVGFSKNLKESGGGNVHVTAAVINKGMFQDIDVVWTTMPEHMV